MPAIQPKPQNEDRDSKPDKDRNEPRQMCKISCSDHSAFFLARRFVFFLDFLPAVGAVPGHPLDVHIGDRSAVIPCGERLVFAFHVTAPENRGGTRTGARCRSR